MSRSTPQALIFDLGGVLIDIDFALALKTWQPKSRLSSEEIARKFRFDRPYELHERGEIGGTAYFQHLIATLELEDDVAHVAHGWNAIFVKEIEETTHMVRAMRERLPCYAFTNTNATHMATWSALYPGVAASFDRVFASHLMGARKPEPAAFSHIVRETGVAPEAMVFFDDSPVNIAGAEAAGWRGVLVRSPQDVKDALQEIGAIP